MTFRHLQTFLWHGPPGGVWPSTFSVVTSAAVCSSVAQCDALEPRAWRAMGWADSQPVFWAVTVYLYYLQVTDTDTCAVFVSCMHFTRNFTVTHTNIYGYSHSYGYTHTYAFQWVYMYTCMVICTRYLTVGLRVGLHGLHSTVFATLCNNSGWNTECRFWCPVVHLQIDATGLRYLHPFDIIWSFDCLFRNSSWVHSVSPISIWIHLGNFGNSMDWTHIETLHGPSAQWRSHPR